MKASCHEINKLIPKNAQHWYHGPKGQWYSFPWLPHIITYIQYFCSQTCEARNSNFHHEIINSLITVHSSILYVIAHTVVVGVHFEGQNHLLNTVGMEISSNLKNVILITMAMLQIETIEKWVICKLGYIY